jgi:hypothetical protein
MDQLYDDKIDGKVREEFWTRKQAEYCDQKRSLQTTLLSLSRPMTGNNVLNETILVTVAPFSCNGLGLALLTSKRNDLRASLGSSESPVAPPSSPRPSTQNRLSPTNCSQGNGDSTSYSRQLRINPFAIRTMTKP